MCQGKFHGALPEKYEQGTKKGGKLLCSVFREYRDTILSRRMQKVR